MKYPKIFGFPKVMPLLEELSQLISNLRGFDFTRVDSILHDSRCHVKSNLHGQKHQLTFVDSILHDMTTM